MSRGDRRAVAAAAAVAALLMAAAPAAAAQRYASPTGAGTACTQASPCPIQTAVNGASGGDEVIVNPGDYATSFTLVPPANAYVHGISGQPAPRIHFAASHYLWLNNAGDRASHLAVDGVTTAPLQVDQTTAEADQVFAHASGGDGCLVYGTLIDSICWTSSPGGEAISGGATTTYTPVLRNVTAEATGSGGIGLSYHASASGSFTISATNLIVHGASTDIFVQADLPATATINIDHSSFASGSGSGTGAHINASAKQTAAPLFVNAGVGDFREAPGSPTIDAGVTAAANGPFDFEGQPRVINGAADIGADEYDPFAGVTIGTTRAKVKHGKARIPVGCPAAAPPPCDGTLTLTFKQRSKAVTAGSGTFSIQPGATEAVKVKIRKKAMSRLDRRGKLGTQASAAATDGAGTSRTAMGTVKLKLKA